DAGTDGADLTQTKTPWLVPGFDTGGSTDMCSGTRFTDECRGNKAPLTGQDAAKKPNLAGSNPIPDGRPRKRTVRLVDGLVYDSETMVILFSETFDSAFLGGLPDGGTDKGFVKYGIMVLKRTPQPPVLMAAPVPPPADTRQAAVQLQDGHACDE